MNFHTTIRGVVLWCKLSKDIRNLHFSKFYRSTHKFMLGPIGVVVAVMVSFTFAGFSDAKDFIYEFIN